MNFNKITKRFAVVGLLCVGARQATADVAKIKPLASFSYLINGEVKDPNPNVSVYFVDLFDSSTSRISKIKASNRAVVCYFSAGTREDWRDDKSEFSNSAVGRVLGEWPNEKWLDYRHPSVRKVMEKRIALAKSKGCEALDPDNVDGHLNKTGFKLTEADQKNYLTFLSQTAKKHGMKLGLKNTAEIAEKLEPLFDFVVIEECQRYKECDQYAAFAKAKKPMFMIEYSKFSQVICDKAKKAKANAVFADYALTKFTYCK